MAKKHGSGAVHDEEGNRHDVLGLGNDDTTLNGIGRTEFQGSSHEPIVKGITS